MKRYRSTPSSTIRMRRRVIGRLWSRSGMLMTATLVAALTITAAVKLKAGDRDHADAGFGANRASAVERATLQSGAHRFVIGARAVYRLNYKGTSAADLGKLLEGERRSNEGFESTTDNSRLTFQTEFHAELVSTVLRVEDDWALVAYRFRDPTLKLETNDTPTNVDLLTMGAELGRDVLAVVNSLGRVVSVCFAPGTSSRTQGLAGAALGLSQFVFPGSLPKGSQSWESQEDDAAGKYIAHYQADPSSSQRPDIGRRSATDKPPLQGIGVFRKSKLRYLASIEETDPQQPGVERVIEPGGQVTARFDFPAGRLLSLAGAESQRVFISRKTVAISNVAIDMSYLGDEEVSDAELGLLLQSSDEVRRTVIAAPLSSPSRGENLEAGIQLAKLGDSTLPSLLADLAAADAASASIDDSHLYLKFKALLYLHPELSAVLGQIIADVDPGSLTMRVLVGALAAVGHEQAQAALASAIRSRAGDWSALSRLIPALSSARVPSQLAEDTLRELAANSRDWDIASTAQLALATVARNVDHSSPERAAGIVDELIAQLETPPSDAVAGQLLLALGNAGAVRALPMIERSLANKNTQLRATAALALRWIESDRADALLARTLTSDTHAVVRAEAATALGFRRMTAVTFAAQKQALVIDDNSAVRLAVLDSLWRSREYFTEAQRLVRRTIAHDSSKEVRSAAANLVAR